MSFGMDTLIYAAREFVKSADEFYPDQPTALSVRLETLEMAMDALAGNWEPTPDDSPLRRATMASEVVRRELLHARWAEEPGRMPYLNRCRTFLLKALAAVEEAQGETPGLPDGVIVESKCPVCGEASHVDVCCPGCAHIYVLGRGAIP